MFAGLFGWQMGRPAPRPENSNTHTHNVTLRVRRHDGVKSAALDSLSKGATRTLQTGRKGSTWLKLRSDTTHRHMQSTLSGEIIHSNIANLNLTHFNFSSNIMALYLQLLTRLFHSVYVCVCPR